MRSDIEIRSDVMEELEWEVLINSDSNKRPGIGVSVINGKVTLSGKVNSYSKKAVAELATTRVAGIKEIVNNLEVELPDEHKLSDKEISELVKHALKWNTSIPEDLINVKVENGWVLLDGRVDWEFQKSSAASAIEYLRGVKGIHNRMEVDSKLTFSNDVRDKIRAAFRRNHYLDANKIKVEVNEHVATLKGHVRTIAEKMAAEKATWSAPGISKVENKLEIDYSEIFA